MADCWDGMWEKIMLLIHVHRHTRICCYFTLRFTYAANTPSLTYENLLCYFHVVPYQYLCGPTL